MKKLLFLIVPLLINSSLHAQTSDSTFALNSAEQASQSLFKVYWVPVNGDFVGGNNYWFYAHSIDIAAMALARTPSQEKLNLLDTLYTAQVKRGYLQGKSVFFDDENWMALSLTRAYVLTGNKKYLETATQLFDDVLTRGTLNRTVGVWWNYEHGKVATASNAGPVITAVLLWKLTQKQQYIDFAQKNYAFWRDQMVNKSTYQVYDQILANGQVDTTAFSYDQGLMIGAAVELYKVTHQESFLNEARAYADYMMNFMSSQNGIMIEQLCLTRLSECITWKDVAQFKGIAFRYLVELLKVDPQNTQLRDYLDQTAHAIMSPQSFDSNSGRFAFEWDGRVTPQTGYYQTANSSVLALSAYATLYGHACTDAKPNSFIRCENALDDFGF